MRFSSALQIFQQVDHLRLDRHVERRHRLVADDELGLHRERARDHDALALAAGKFVRVAAHVLALQPDLDEQARHAVVALAGRSGELVDDEGFAEDRADGHARVERGERVLEHDLHVAPHRAQIVAAEAQHVLPVEHDLADVGSIRRSTQRAVVDLPQPDSPTSPSVSPRLTANDTPSTAWTRPTSRDNRPPRTGKCFFRSVTRSRGSLMRARRLPDGRPCDGRARSRAAPAPFRCKPLMA